jgi:GNAT superfamily N-acetyltransferase
MPTRVAELTTDAEWDRAVPIIQQLWADKSRAEILDWREEDYRLLGLFVDDELVGIAGLYLQVVLHHQWTGWIHDLVVDEAHRSQGYGAELLAAATEWAAERDCETVALVNTVDNDEATRFYEEEMERRFGSVYETRQ